MVNGHGLREWERFANDWAWRYTHRGESLQHIAETSGFSRAMVQEAIWSVGVQMRTSHRAGDPKCTMPPQVSALLIALSPSEIMTISEIQECTGDSYDEIDRRVGYLELSGFVERLTPSTFKLTQSGRDALEQYKESATLNDGDPSS